MASENVQSEKTATNVQQLENGSPEPSEHLKCSKDGTLLVPQPSDDPDDPLNWSLAKKNILLAVMCFVTFTGIGAVTGTVIATPIQAEGFEQTPEVVSWTVSGTVAGCILGPLIFIPFARVFGMCSISFWTTILTTLCLIWSGSATSPEQFTSYSVSRGLTGMVASVAQVLVAGFIVNVYYLHERGRAFAVYSCVYALGANVPATFNGYVVNFVSWPNIFWWQVAGSGFAATLIFALMEEPGFTRKASDLVYPKKPKSWLKSRVATFLPGTAVVPPVSARDVARFAITTGKIGFSSCTIFAGIFAMVNFAWLVLTSIEIPIYLQQPYKPEVGLYGYGFSALGTANFQYSVWAGVFFAQIYTALLNDRWPMWLARRSGKFKPEYRLYPASFSGFVIGPIGLGLFGASIKYHFHWMVLAVATSMINFAGGVSVSTSINYVAESFRSYPQEVGAAMNAWRIGLSILIPFFYNSWAASVGVDWLWGTAAFIEVVAFLSLVVLMVWGEKLRRSSLVKDVI